MTRGRGSGWLACWIVCFACAVVFVDAKDTAAMSCAPTPLATVARQAAAIFEATVVAVTVHPRPVTQHPDGTVSFVAASQPATATLTDVAAIRGVPPATIESVERVLVAGRRYLFLAMAYPQRPGVLVAGECAGYVRPAARAGEFKAWLESLDRPATGGRILGSVVARSAGDDVSTWPPVGGAPVFLHARPRSSDPADLAYWIGKSDGVGRYEFRGVPPGYYVVTIDEPFTPAYARTIAGGDELVVGHAERLELAPLVATRGTTILVEGLLVDSGGRPVESAFRVEVLGSLGPYPKSGSTEESDASGRFRLRLFSGLRYRFSLFVPNDAASVTVDYVADGTPVRLVAPNH